MIRILHSVSNMDRAGIETMLMNYYRYMDKSKVQFDFLCNKKKPGAYDDEIKSMGGRIYHTPGLNPAKYPVYLKYMRELFQEHPEYKIIEAHNGALGVYLATRALSFEIDKQTGEIKRAPLIAINDLKNESERNEQDGIRYMLMGFFQGPRNLYQHNHIGSGVSNSISVIIEASFFLHLLDGHSITQNGRWIPEKVDYREIYQKMPKRIDRWKLVRLLKKRTRYLAKKN